MDLDKAEQLDPTNIDTSETAEIFSELLKIPILSGARILDGTENGSFVNIYSEWTSIDVINKDKCQVGRTFHILKKSDDSSSLDPSTFTTSNAVPLGNVKVSSFSDSSRKRAFVTVPNADSSAGKASDGDTGEILRIYNEEKLWKTFDLKKLDNHKAIYNNGGEFGSSFVWSKDERKIAYLAEKKLPKAESFLTSTSCSSFSAGGDSPDGQKTDETRKGEEYAFRQCWGEQMSNIFQSVIVILDIGSEKFEVIQLPDNLFPTDLQWVENSSIVGNGLVETDWRLGLIYCTNRESRIFQIGIDGQNFRYLSKAGRSAISPRVSPSAQTVIWQERIINGPHDKSKEVHAIKLQENLEESKVVYSLNPSTNCPIYENFPLRPWSNEGSYFFTVTNNETERVLLKFEFFEDRLEFGTTKIIRDVNGFFGHYKNYLLLSRSSAIISPYLFLMNENDGNGKEFRLTEPSRPVTQQVQRLIVTGRDSPSSIFYGPDGNDVPISSVPLIVNPHGGPHAVFYDAFVPEIALFLKLGYGILRINYVGSTGGIKDVTEVLCGKVGTLDVDDCQEQVEKILNLDSKLDRNKIVYFGGSHAGFLGAHLSSKYADYYKAIVLRNPVTDLLSMISMTDITDCQYWKIMDTRCYVEGGVQKNLSSFLPYCSNLEDAKKFIDASPIKNAGKVQGATLLLVGSEDLRVPMKQGMAYYRALIAAKKVAEIRVYPDCHPLQKIPVRFDSILHSVIWFAKYLKK